MMSLMVFGSAIACYAANYRLKITDTSDHIHYFDLDENLKLEVEGSALKVTAADGDAEILLTDLKGFGYEQGSSALEVAASGNYRITADGIVYTAPDENPHSYAVYNTAGAKVTGGQFCHEVRIDFAQLAAGTYILSLEGLAPIKFAVR